MKRIEKKLRRRKRAARKLPTCLQDIALSKNRHNRGRHRHLKGKFGPASGVRHIDPGFYNLVED